jgi:chromosome segregation ATPase
MGLPTTHHTKIMSRRQLREELEEALEESRDRVRELETEIDEIQSVLHDMECRLENYKERVASFKEDLSLTVKLYLHSILRDRIEEPRMIDLVASLLPKRFKRQQPITFASRNKVRRLG